MAPWDTRNPLRQHAIGCAERATLRAGRVYGSRVQTPNLDPASGNGMRYTQTHTVVLRVNSNAEAQVATALL
jgi:hypothetical protein